MRRKKSSVRRLKSSDGLRNNAQKRLERYTLGLNEGYLEGLQAGIDSYEDSFDGTSIIIPCHNEIDSVKVCIENIMDHTDLPYEIIVVDNGSTDGIEQYLKQLDGQVRYRILPKLIGFIGAANRGIMMAKGTTLLLLSSRIQVTENWLENLLLCLNSDKRIGMVGPVSNGFRDSQRMEVPYGDLEEMHELARVNNKSDSSKWHEAEHLSYSCLLLRRDLLESVGYWDEGCQEAALAAEDYGFRVRLQGYSMVYARDAYVHAEEEIVPAGEVARSNSYLLTKWNVPNGRLTDIDSLLDSPPHDLDYLIGGSSRSLGEAAFYPREMVVKGLGNTVYWIEGSVRRPIEGSWDYPVVSLSQLDVWRWKIGEPIAAANLQALLGIRTIEEYRTSLSGSICIGAGGSSYYLEKGSKRPIVSKLAAESWGIQNVRETFLSEDELAAIPDSLPIIAPIKLYQTL